MTQLEAPVQFDVVTARPVRADELAARHALRGQIRHLEGRLSDLVVASMPDGGVTTPVPATRGARVLTLGELEVIRDALAGRVAEARAVLDARDRRREDARLLLERMLLAPGDHRRARITQRELGESGCGVWSVRPRLGLVGRLMGWWHVTLSSGCPLSS